MSTYTRVYGNTTANKYQVAASLVGGFSTFSYGAMIVVLRAPSQEVGATSQNFLSTHSSVSDGLRFYFQSGDIFGYWRTSGTSAAVKLVDTYVPGELYVIGLHAATNGVQQFTVNGVVHATTISMASSVTLRGASNMIPWIQGINLNDFDYEISDFAFWVSNTESDIPTIEEIQGYQAGQPMLTASAATKIHLKAVGTSGASVGQFTDQFGTNHATHVAGDLDDSSENRPIYVLLDDPASDFTVAAETTARTITLTGSVSAAGGTVYAVVDTAGNLPSAPDASDIVGGFLGNGTTAALASGSVDMTGITSFELVLSALPANTEMAHALIYDADNAGDYSTIAYGTISTKRPIVVPSGAEKRLVDKYDDPVLSESGMTMWVLGTAYSQAGYSTDASGFFELDLTNYMNTVGSEDIGDEVDIVLTLSDGRGVVSLAQTITEGA